MKTLYEMTKRVLSAIHHTWVEKLARKRKASLSRKKRKPQETLVIYSYLEYMLLALLIMQEQSTATTDGVHTFSRSHTLTELLTVRNIHVYKLIFNLSFIKVCLTFLTIICSNHWITIQFLYLWVIQS